jgi:hypothetical protein
MFGRKFYECGRRPHAGHLLDKIEGGIGVLVSKFEELIVVVPHTLNRSQITVLDEVGRFSRGDTFSYVSLAWVVPFSVISRNACGAPVFVPVVAGLRRLKKISGASHRGSLTFFNNFAVLSSSAKT